MITFCLVIRVLSLKLHQVIVLLPVLQRNCGMRYHLTYEALAQLVFLSRAKNSPFSSCIVSIYSCFYYCEFTFNCNLSFLNYCKFTPNCNFIFLAFSFCFLILSCAFEHFMELAYYKWPIIIIIIINTISDHQWRHSY